MKGVYGSFRFLKGIEDSLRGLAGSRWKEKDRFGMGYHVGSHGHVGRDHLTFTGYHIVCRLRLG